MTTTTIMLYVEKVKENADFWEKYLDFKETERFDFWRLHQHRPGRKSDLQSATVQYRFHQEKLPGSGSA